MTSVNKTHQSGHARAYVEHTPFNGVNYLYLMYEGNVVKFDGHGLIFRPMEEGIRVETTDSIASWSDLMEDRIVDMFKAIGKALEIYSDEPAQAYKQGYAEGEAKVLREWNESLRG